MSTETHHDVRSKCVWFPVFDDKAELAHHSHCADFFLPTDLTRAEFHISRRLWKDKLPPPVPEYCIAELPPGITAHLDKKYLCSVPESARLAAANADYVFLWDSRARAELGDVPGQIICVDRIHEQWDCYNYPMFMDRFVTKEDKAALSDASHVRFLDRLHTLEHGQGKMPCYIFGTGPSVMEAYDLDFSNGFRIICNTIIKNTRMMDHLRPHFIVAADAIYHYGISRYARQFQNDLHLFLQTTDCMLIMQEVLAFNYLRLYPDVADRIVAIPYVYDYKPTVSLRERWAVTPFHNVLNQFLLPLASSISDVVALLGFDGRKNTDVHFWGTDESINYEELKPLHQQAHPGFFDNMSYAEYAQVLSTISGEILDYGEKHGKRYVCLNDSSNTALQERRGQIRVV